MDETAKLEQAQAIAGLLPALMRRFTAMDDDPAAELPLAQLRVCSILHGGPRPMSMLSRELGVSLSAMTQIADRLERVRLVERVAETTDRRVKCLQLTERGQKVMRHHDDARVQRVLAVLERLPPQAREGVLSALQTLLSACTAADGQDDRISKVLR